MVFVATLLRQYIMCEKMTPVVIYLVFAIGCTDGPAFIIVPDDSGTLATDTDNNLESALFC